MNDELKPCPFCGGWPYPKRTEDTDWPGSCFVSMKCIDCGAETHAVYGTGDPTEWADARAAWNRRASTDKAPAERGA